MKKIVLLTSLSLSVFLLSFITNSTNEEGRFCCNSKKGEWTIQPDGCSHACVRGGARNCIVTGGIDSSGCQQQ